MAKKPQSPPKNFEDALEELERILGAIEQGQVGLEESLAKYEHRDIPDPTLQGRPAVGRETDRVVEQRASRNRRPRDCRGRRGTGSRK